MKKRTAKIITGFAILIIIVCTSLAIFKYTGKRALRQAQEALESDGRPLYVTDIIPPEIPNEDNAAIIYRAAALLLKAETSGEDGLLSSLAETSTAFMEGELSEQQAEAFQQLLDSPSVADALNLVRGGSKRSGCRFDVNYYDGPAMQLTHIHDLIMLSKITSAHAVVTASRGDANGAYQELVCALRLANALQSEPLLISKLVRAEQFRTAAEAIHKVSAIALPTREQSGELMRLLQEFEAMEPLIQAMDGERLLFGEWMFPITMKTVSTGLLDGNDSWGGGFVVMWLYALVAEHDYATYLNIMRSMTKAVEQPYPHNKQEIEPNYNDMPFYCIVTRHVAPASSTLKGRYTTMVASARVTRAGLEMMGQAPAPDGTSDGLATDILDPFTGKPLQVKKTDLGITIRSLGENAKEDGESDSGEQGNDDIVWDIIYKRGQM